MANWSKMLKKAASSVIANRNPHRSYTSAIFTTSTISTSNHTTDLFGKVFRTTSIPTHHHFSDVTKKTSDSDDRLNGVIETEIDCAEEELGDVKVAKAPREFPSGPQRVDLDVSVVKGLTNFSGSLVSIHGSATGEGGGDITMTTAGSVTRIAKQGLGPYGLQRQAVNGVLCFTTKDAFLLSNPTTGDTSPWIETTTCNQPLEGRRQVDSIALGFDPYSNKHKVVCISSSMEKTKDGDEAERLVVEVLTVRRRTWTSGEHQWRKLDIVPPSLSKVGRFASFVDGPLCINGRIHWHFSNAGIFEYFLHFHVGSESFSCALLPERLNSELVSSSRHGDSSIHIRTLLMEVNGNLAILKSSSDDQETSSLWIRHILSTGTFQWREEKVWIPYTYVYPGSSIEALTGTHFIFIQSQDGRISYYNRKTKVFLPLTIPTLPIPDHFDLGRTIKL